MGANIRGVPTFMGCFQSREYMAYSGIAAAAAFCTTGTTITLVGLALGKIFISRLAHYNAMNT